ncbi:MAG: archaellar assembly protein FlaJ [Methanomassiliicoccales archaeon]|nr:MAG: archaellar assembly protein FlaJ [Methanomassiliicoccales archaeon]
MKYKDALSTMDMAPKKFMLILFFTVIAFGIALPMVLWLYLSPLLQVGTMAVALALPMFLVLVVFIWPLLMASQRRIKTDRQLPAFVTELAALSTSDMSFDKIFYILSQKSEYGPLSGDAKKIYRLIKHYNVSAAEACRFVSAKTPSKMAKDFYSRLAHSIEVGEPLDRFMRNEHDIMMDEFMLKCETALKDVDFMKEIFTGIITSLIFVCVFVAITPILGSTAVEVMIYGVIIAFLFMEGLFVYLIISKMPKDDIWYSILLKIKNRKIGDKDRILIVSIFVAIFGMVALTSLLLPLHLPWMLLVSSVCLPSLIPGILIFREEKGIEKRDAVFGALIRSLGRSASVSGQTMADSVKKIAIHKFGPLTKPVRNLSRRLAMYIDPRESWAHFAAETGSNSIRRFSNIYMECILAGSKPDETSLFISNNIFKILAIRKKRITLSGNFLGMLYGVAVALAVTLWVTVAITEYMADVIANINLSHTGSFDIGFISSIFNANFNSDLLTIMVVSVVVIHSFFSALMIPLIKGGHIASAAVHFVVLVWIGAFCDFIVGIVMKGVLS